MYPPFHMTFGGYMYEQLDKKERQDMVNMYRKMLLDSVRLQYLDNAEIWPDPKPMLLILAVCFRGDE